ncbi:MAG: hypothetical protein KAJ10_03565 [Thermodesulfovibrionia bacterium]|nr:hypothetical protein [Thermodesulfovibrionia bacterium]
MKYELIKYKPLHAYEIFDKEIKEIGLVLSATGDWEGAAERWWTAGPGYTLMMDGEPIACGGIALLDPTYGECWLFVPRHDHGIVVFRHVLRMLQRLIDEHKFRRLQAHVVEGFDEGEFLMKRLGFECEGRLKKYFPNGDNAKIYAKVF